MADEQPATDSSPEERLAAFFGADAGKPETPPEGQAREASASAEQPQVESTQEAEEQPEEGSDGFEEIDLDGETYRVPPKLKEAVLRQEDYTRKTQEVAEARRQIQSQAQMAHLNNLFQQQAAPDYQALQQVENQIQQYQKLNWSEFDAQTHLEARRQLDSLKEQHANIRQGLAGKAQNFMSAAQALYQQQLQVGVEYLRRSIPKFDQNTVNAIRSYASNEGFSEPEVDTISDPRLVKVLWKAQQYDMLQSGRRAAVESVRKAPPVIKPGASQGQAQVAANKYKEAREKLRKSGRMEDAAALFLQRMK